MYLVNLNKKIFHFQPNPKTADKGQLAARGIAISEKLMTVALEPDKVGQFNFQSKTWKLNDLQSRTIYQINENEYWVGAFRYLIHHKNDKETRYFIPEIKGLLYNTIWSIAPSTKNPNILWLGTKKGLMSFNTTTKEFKKFTQTNELQQDTFCLIQDIIPDNKIATQYWLCSDKGLFLMDENNGYLAKYTDETEGVFYLPATNFHHSYQDKEGIFWLSTNKGLIRWDVEKDEYRHFTQKDGLANDVIYAVYEDDFNNLWMSSDFGIIRMNKETFNVHNYLPNSGIGQKEFNRISHLKTANGKIYFGGLTGITSFYPKDFQVKNAEDLPKLILSKYQAYNGKERETNDKTLEVKQNQKIVLRPSDYIIDLQFSVLSYNNVDNNTYSYQLSKNGKPYTDWQTQKKRSLQLGQLPYGKYKLTVKGKNAFNTACENEIILDIIILRPFYLTWWFTLIVSSLLIALTYAYTSWRTKSLQIQQENLKNEIQKATQKIRTDKQTIEAQAEDLRKLDELKTRFFANVSHELRTPLTLMLGPIKSVLKRNNIDNKTYTFLSTAEQNGHQLLKLVNEILDLNKLEAGKIELDEKTIAFYPFIKRLASNFTSYAENAKVRFTFDYQIERDIHLSLDTKKFETIINNLLANAFKFTPQNGLITIQVLEKKNKIQVGVIDSGRGIHPEDLPNIFNRFYQTKQKGAAEGGTGIGLALCKEFAELLDGSIYVESELSKGSQFYLEIPRKEVLKTLSDTDSLVIQDKFEMEIKAKTGQYSVSENGKIQTLEGRSTILIVEDNVSLQNYLKLILEEFYEIVLANNGKEAIQILNANRGQNQFPSLILSDIMMPIMDGYQLLETLKTSDDWRHIPVVMLTARADKEDKLDALRIGVDDYVLKPFDEDELLARISNLLANRKIRQLDIKDTKTISKGKTEKTIKYSAQDSEWLKELEEKVSANISVTNFTTEALAEEMTISRRQLNRKIKEYTGLTPNKYITEVRLQKARTLLEQSPELTVKEVSYKVGFLKTAYFSKLFIERFGKRPSDVLV